MDNRISSDRYGLAVDFGTSSIRAALMDRNNGAILFRAACESRLNAFGPDILTRIEYASRGESCLEELHNAAADSLTDVLAALSAVSGADLCDVPAMVLAVNTTQMYLLLGRDPGCIARPPYELPLHAPGQLRGDALGLPFAGEIFFVPCRANYLGGDALCSLLAADLRRAPDGTALYDLGANAEFIVKRGDTLYAGSCAAGCALGAVEFSASELTACVAELSEQGLLNRRGRLAKGDPRVEELVREGSSRLMAAVRFGERLLTQADIALFIQAKASAATMVDYMLEAAGLTAEELQTVTLTSALCCALDRDAAIAVGLLPELQNGQYKTLEDAVLRGAAMLLSDPAAMDEAKAIYESLRYVQLREVEDYLELMLPHLEL